MNLDALIIAGPNDCWPWTGYQDKYGYGRARRGGSAPHEGIHRFVYELVCGEIPEGCTIDHLCENKLCQNPSHLEAVSAGVNVLRSAHTLAGGNARKSVCPKCGGDYECESRPEGGWRRFCRNCRNAYLREWSKKNRAKATAAHRRWRQKNPTYYRDRYDPKKQSEYNRRSYLKRKAREQEARD